MLKTITHIKGFSIRATDGELGTVGQVYFDDVSWTVRYFTVDTGGWLGGRRVLISLYSVIGVNWAERRVDVSLTREQVKNSPDIDTHRPVSRQHEAEYLGAFGYPNYWGGPFSWGGSYYPGDYVPVPVAAPQGTESKDSHLRSTSGVSGYDIQAIDGEIGHVISFVLDDETWAIRYIEVGTRNWWPGKKVLLAPAWIQRISWISSKFYVSISREAIQGAPAYVEGTPVTREYEALLYQHYERIPYWESQPERVKISDEMEGHRSSLLRA